MDYRSQTYIVRTLHSQSGCAFIVPVEVEAGSLYEAACKRFDMLSPSEQAVCRALLAEVKLCGAPCLFEVKSKPAPQYSITAAYSD